ncbi:MAG: translation initiation factor IF-2 [Patescibacteria group bacterium]
MDEKNTSHSVYPPVVAVLGHVDHGKTTLLDAIRQTSLATREKGGITQTIGASSIEIEHEGKHRNITFIDTPGHEAFTKMRGRGAQVADIALLILSATDGVKPQTRESIEVLRATKTPFIVVITKIDLPTANPEKAKQSLLAEQVSLEGYGGDIPTIAVSAKTNQNIQELLDLILLYFDMHKSPEYTKEVSSEAPLQAIVIESRLDNRAGPKATIVIKNGTITVRSEFQVASDIFKVRALVSPTGNQVQQATVGEAVEVIGLQKVPEVGAVVRQKQSTREEKETPSAPLQRELVYRQIEKEKTGISVILIADTQGSLEAIIQAFPEEISVISKKTGEVTEADVLLAKSTGSIILSFNTKLRPDVVRLAYTEKVLLRNYEIIYELLDELSDALEGKLLSQMEQVFGKATILAKFPFEKTYAFGISVIEGRIARSDKVRIMRGETVVGETTLQSLRINKNPTSKVEKGHEAGLVFTAPLDILVGDMLISHS